MSRPRRLHRPSAFSLNLIVGFTGLTIAALSFVSLGPAASAGAVSGAPIGNGADWGSQGAIASDSSVTVRWDNEGNSADNTVYRDQRQTLLHTNNKTYFDVTAGVRNAYKNYAGAENKFGGMAVSVSQTENLVNQGVQVSVTGLPGGGTSNSDSFVQILQCWGAMGADGKPDPAATSPDQASCQFGLGSSDGAGDNRGLRSIATDGLTNGGDWEKYAGVSPGSDAPFVSIDGQQAFSSANPFFNKSTTNELAGTKVAPSGSVTRQFEIQTGGEASGLGCGYRSDAPSTPSCWLVVVPRLPTGTLSDRDWGPLAPSIWSQRLQVKLGFTDIAPACPSGQAQLLIGGSELLTTAAASWIPALCDERSIALGFSQYGDEVARAQLVTGSSDAIVSTRPLAKNVAASYTPLALAAPVIAVQVDYRPVCDAPGHPLENVTTNELARECGYDDLGDLQADVALTSTPIRDVRLNARLVAKLLTQSYSCSYSCAGGFGLAISDWSRNAGYLTDLFRDPEFRELNPQLRHMPTAPGQNLISDAMVEGMRSDAANAVWEWVLADVGARSFLNGCPDPWDHVVNPYYSTRTYEECGFRTAVYGKPEAANRKLLESPQGYIDEGATYPSDGSPYPLIPWFEERSSIAGNVNTMTDMHPRLDTMPVAARSVFRGMVPRNSEWCPTSADSTCLPAPGKLRDPKVPQYFGERAALAITDTASAARYQLTTAKLCDETGHDCVGADSASLAIAADAFGNTEVAGVVAPAMKPDYANGAYPIAMPVYGIVKSGVSAADARAYADTFEFVTTNGQKPGLMSGTLPPGYAPLTSALVKQAEKSITVLRAGAVAADPDDGDNDHPAPTDDQDAPADVSPPADPGVHGDNDVPSSEPTPAATPSATSAPVAATFTTPSEHTAPQLALPIGLAIALLSGIFAPFLRKRTRVRVQR